MRKEEEKRGGERKEKVAGKSQQSYDDLDHCIHSEPLIILEASRNTQSSTHPSSAETGRSCIPFDSIPSPASRKSAVLRQQHSPASHTLSHRTESATRRATRPRPWLRKREGREEASER
jgi:hypothetical protein